MNAQISEKNNTLDLGGILNNSIMKRAYVFKSGKIEVATSFVLRHENNKDPYPDKRKAIADFIEKYTTFFVDSKSLAEEIMSTGVKEVDAAHIACAILAECDYFLKTDDRV